METMQKPPASRGGGQRVPGHGGPSRRAQSARAQPAPRKRKMRTAWPGGRMRLWTACCCCRCAGCCPFLAPSICIWSRVQTPRPDMAWPSAGVRSRAACCLRRCAWCLALFAAPRFHACWTPAQTPHLHLLSYHHISVQPGQGRRCGGGQPAGQDARQKQGCCMVLLTWLELTAGLACQWVKLHACHSNTVLDRALSLPDSVL